MKTQFDPLLKALAGLLRSLAALYLKMMLRVYTSDRGWKRQPGSPWTGSIIISNERWHTGGTP